MAKRIENRIIESRLIEWQKLQFIQTDTFKEMSEVQFRKLVTSIQRNGFIAPFYVWEAPDGVLWCLDGYHRKLVMTELQGLGHPIPKTLPAVLVRCDNMAQARKLVLVFSSAFARITIDGLHDFVLSNDILFADVKNEIDLPGINLAEFESFMLDPTGGQGDGEGQSEPKAAKESRFSPGERVVLGDHTLEIGNAGLDVADRLVKYWERITGEKVAR